MIQVDKFLVQEEMLKHFMAEWRLSCFRHVILPSINCVRCCQTQLVFSTLEPNL